HASTTALSDTFDLAAAGNGDHGDMITVEVTPSDGAPSGTTVSDTATVASTPPTATVSPNAHQPGTDDVLTASATKSDLDGDAVTLTYVRRLHGALPISHASTTALSDTFDLAAAGNGDHGDTITVEVTPSDGALSGTTVSDT